MGNVGRHDHNLSCTNGHFFPVNINQGFTIQNLQQGVTRCGMRADAFSLDKGKKGYTEGRVLCKCSADDPPFLIINQINQAAGSGENNAL